MHRIFAGMAFWAVAFMLGEGVLGILTKHYDQRLVGWHLVLSVFHHYAFADRDLSAATSTEDLWRFCLRALDRRPSD